MVCRTSTSLLGPEAWNHDWQTLNFDVGGHCGAAPFVASGIYGLVRQAGGAADARWFGWLLHFFRRFLSTSSTPITTCNLPPATCHLQTATSSARQHVSARSIPVPLEHERPDLRLRRGCDAGAQGGLHLRRLRGQSLPRQGGQDPMFTVRPSRAVQGEDEEDGAVRSAMTLAKRLYYDA